MRDLPEEFQIHAVFTVISARGPRRKIAADGVILNRRLHHPSVEGRLHVRIADKTQFHAKLFDRMIVRDVLSPERKDLAGGDLLLRERSERSAVMTRDASRGRQIDRRTAGVAEKRRLIPCQFRDFPVDRFQQFLHGDIASRRLAHRFQSLFRHPGAADRRVGSECIDQRRNPQLFIDAHSSVAPPTMDRYHFPVSISRFSSAAIGIITLERIRSGHRAFFSSEST